MECALPKSKPDIYGGKDPREAPAYTVADAARFLKLPTSTLRSWTFGQPYSTKGGDRIFEPLIHIEDPGGALSFIELTEAHVLSALRRKHHIDLPSVRRTLKRLAQEYPAARHPLAQHQFATAGYELFVEEFGRLTNYASGQIGLKEVLEDYLQRIERDPDGVPTVLYPFPPNAPTHSAPKRIALNPRIAWGRPVIAGTSIPTATIADRIAAGETPDELAADFDRPQSDILAAIAWELARAA